MLDTVLLVASVILLALAGLGVTRRVNVGWLGMALFVLTFLVQGRDARAGSRSFREG